jgi:fucose permease
MNLAEERMHITGAIAGLFLVGAGMGGMILPWLIGQVFERVGAGAMMGLILGDSVLNLLMFFLFIRVSAKPESVAQSTAITD